MQSVSAPTAATETTGRETFTPKYIVITPARNEAAYIGETIKSMLAQTHLPMRWLIVSDGSTDGTDDVVKELAGDREWIEIIRMPEHRDRSFAAKVDCFEAALTSLQGLDFEFLASLDADIAFDSTYFEFILQQFSHNHRLGVAGTPFVEGKTHYDYRFSNIEHVSGACQVFRRSCYLDIGGYLRIKGGGVDWTAVTTARMKGWQTRTFTEKACVHLRPMRTGAKTAIGGAFHHGRRDYYLGGHPLWQMFRAAHQLTRRPYVVGGLALLAGYLWAALIRMPRPVSTELVKFNRAEQMTRLKEFFNRVIAY